jgi:cell division topological specificity factor
MALLDFIQRLVGLQKPSATTAKERLQLVLAHDRSDLNPELLEQMRREILEVVQKYVEIDLDGGDVSLATEDRVTALVANLPIRRAKVRPPSPPPPNPMDSPSPAAPRDAAQDTPTEVPTDEPAAGGTEPAETAVTAAVAPSSAVELPNEQQTPGENPTSPTLSSVSAES